MSGRTPDETEPIDNAEDSREGLGRYDIRAIENVRRCPERDPRLLGHVADRYATADWQALRASSP
jgi:hypothetical protein